MNFEKIKGSAKKVEEQFYKIDFKFIKTIILSSVFLVVGILFCVLQNKALEYVEMATALISLAIGAVYIFIYCLANTSYHDSIAFFKALIASGVGIVLLMVPSIFTIAIGVLAVIFGVLQIIAAIKAKTLNQPEFVFDLVFGIVLTVFGGGIAVLAGTKIAGDILTILTGVLLILKGGSDLVFSIIVKINSIQKPQKDNATQEEFDIDAREAQLKTILEMEKAAYFKEMQKEKAKNDQVDKIQEPQEIQESEITEESKRDKIEIEKAKSQKKDDNRPDISDILDN